MPSLQINQRLFPLQTSTKTASVYSPIDVSTRFQNTFRFRTNTLSLHFRRDDDAQRHIDSLSRSSPGVRCHLKVSSQRPHHRSSRLSKYIQLYHRHNPKIPNTNDLLPLFILQRFLISSFSVVNRLQVSHTTRAVRSHSPPWLPLDVFIHASTVSSVTLKVHHQLLLLLRFTCTCYESLAPYHKSPRSRPLGLGHVSTNILDPTLRSPFAIKPDAESSLIHCFFVPPAWTRYFLKSCRHRSSFCRRAMCRLLIWF